jgi:glycerol-3-phosphate acyltransferase PlsY
MTFFLINISAYLIGSIPSAYILSKIIYGYDIRKKGTGNVGTLNFLRVTNSKFFSILVLLMDISKGYLALWFSSSFLEMKFWIFPALLVILGHIYPIWLNFKGGRGMATIAGVFLYIQPLAVAIWWLFFLLIYFFTKKIISSGIFALILINISIVIFWDFQLFIISSASSILVLNKYSARLKEEITNIGKE